MIHEVVPARTQPAPAAEALVVEKPAEETPIEERPIPEKPAAAKPIEVVAVKPAVESSGSSPYDSGVKRAVKSVGRFLHIGGKKEQPSQ